MVMLLLLFIAAFATDLGAWYRQGEEQQRAADVGSLNGVASYDRELKDAIAAAPGDLSTFQDLHEYDVANGTTLSLDAEQAAVLVAVEQIRTLLETSGLTFTGDGIQSQTFNAVAFDANGIATNPNSTSTVTLEADDGTVVVITRSLVPNGFDDATPPNQLYTRAIDVSITRDGEQFFSNILRGAPQIERNAQSLLENCGATCQNQIVFNPPFTGFDAPGNGDGYTPLIFDANFDSQADEIWAVNHHARPGSVGSIICYEADSGNECGGTAYPLNYFTSRESTDYIHEGADASDPHHGKIYFAASLNNRSGIACFDAETRNYCTTPFRDFWNITTQGQHPGFINVNGPFFNNGRLYTVAQNGQVACVQLDMSNCGTGGVQTITYNNAAEFPALNPTGGNRHRLLNGELIGNNLLVTQNTQGGVVITCLDVGAPSGDVTKCNTNSEHYEPGLNGLARNFTFTRYNDTGAAVGVCVWNLDGGHICVDENAQNPTTLPGLTALENVDTWNGGFKGDAFTWDGQRTFFGLGSHNAILCYNWAATNGGAPCTDGPDEGGAGLNDDNDFLVNGLGLSDAVTRERDSKDKAGGLQTYAFAEVTPECIIALGDEAIFFSFNPVGMGPCLDTQITTLIVPCACTDEAAGARWGSLQIPEGLLADVTSLSAKITLIDDPSAPAVSPEFDGVDLLDPAVNGFLDLSSLNTHPSNPAFVYLTLSVISDVDVNGNPIFATPYVADLEVSISPTLSE